MKISFSIFSFCLVENYSQVKSINRPRIIKLYCSIIVLPPQLLTWDCTERPPYHGLTQPLPLFSSLSVDIWNKSDVLVLTQSEESNSFEFVFIIFSCRQLQYLAAVSSYKVFQLTKHFPSVIKTRVNRTDREQRVALDPQLSRLTQLVASLVFSPGPPPLTSRCLQLSCHKVDQRYPDWRSTCPRHICYQKHSYQINVVVSVLMCNSVV